MRPEALPRLPRPPGQGVPDDVAILITTVPLHGHVLPALTIARELTARGHEVRWYTGRAFRPQVEAAGATYVPMTPGLGEHSRDEVRSWPGRPGAQPPPVRPRPRAPAHPPEPGVHRGHPRSPGGRARRPGPRRHRFLRGRPGPRARRATVGGLRHHRADDRLAGHRTVRYRPPPRRRRRRPGPQPRTQPALRAGRLRTGQPGVQRGPPRPRPAAGTRQRAADVVPVPAPAGQRAGL